jgi:NADPH oxidase
MATTEGSMGATRREPMVPQASRIRHVVLHDPPHGCSLRQVSFLATMTLICANSSSFFNVERTQVRPQIALQIHYTEAGGITGHIMLLCMLLIYTTAHHRIRQQSFETFWYTHHLFIPFLLGMYTHATSCFVRDTAPAFSPFDHDNFWTHCIGYEGWRWELVGGGLYLFDRLYREVRSRRETKIVKVVRHPYGKRVSYLQFVTQANAK